MMTLQLWYRGMLLLLAMGGTAVLQSSAAPEKGDLSVVENVESFVERLEELIDGQVGGDDTMDMMEKNGELTEEFGGDSWLPQTRQAVLQSSAAPEKGDLSVVENVESFVERLEELIDGQVGGGDTMDMMEKNGELTEEFGGDSWLPQTRQAGCSSGYRMYNGICYKAFNTPKKFHDASATCAADGGTLAMPKDARTNAFLLSLKNAVHRSGSFWIGLVDHHQEGGWEWIDGTPLGYNAWRPGEPNNVGNEDCAEFNPSQWNDAPCSRTDIKFICQKIPAGCPRGYIYHQPSRLCYCAFNIRRTYNSAVATCSSGGGTLAMPRDIATNDFLIYLKNAVDRNALFRFGLTDHHQEGGWKWANNAPLGSFRAWGPGEPNNLGNEDCAEYFPESSFKKNTWNDGICTRADRKFICQVSPSAGTSGPRRVCEHQTLAISCPAGRQINIVSALYGRTARWCPSSQIRTYNCRSPNSLSRVRTSCQGKSSCAVRASNSVFGDPCVGTFKYLEVSYTCITATSGPRRVCEHQTLAISCPAGRQINIASALYGRTSRAYCPSTLIRTTNCRSPNSLSRVRTSCQGRSSCSVRASNSVFGDPCVGTFKYLEVSYTCIVVPGCRSGYRQHGRNCYKAYNDRKAYNDAAATCRADGGSLAMPRDQATNKFLIYLKNAVDTNSWFRFGLTDHHQEGGWKWADNAPLGSFRAWGPGEPNNQGNEDCAEYFSGRSSKKNTWNDGPCTRADRKFICQVSLSGSGKREMPDLEEREIGETNELPEEDMLEEALEMLENEVRTDEENLENGELSAEFDGDSWLAQTQQAGAGKREMADLEESEIGEANELPEEDMLEETLEMLENEVRTEEENLENGELSAEFDGDSWLPQTQQAGAGKREMTDPEEREIGKTNELPEEDMLEEALEMLENEVRTEEENMDSEYGLEE